MPHFIQVCTLLAWACVFLQVHSQSDSGEPLYLTPLINAGRIEEALEASSVTLEPYPEVKSHSGFITVNSEFDSNLFFWHFPSKLPYADPNVTTIPVVLWQDGGPGTSCLTTIFGPAGPFLPNITKNENNETNYDFTLNEFSWNIHHMIYVGNPVNVGFSHTGSRAGHIDSPEGAARDIYSFLLQFFKMFPHLKQNPFYVAGVSYGGTYAINVAHLIHQMNKNVLEEEKINLKGIYMDSPWIEAYSQVQYGEVLFNAGLITEEQQEVYLLAEQEIRELITEEKYADASKIFLNVTQVWPKQMTGYASIYDMENFFKMDNMTGFVTLNETRKAIHVGGQVYTDSSTYQQELMQEAMMKSQKDKLDDILKNRYRIFVMVGNMDVITGHVGIRNVFKSLTWDQKEGFLSGYRQKVEVFGDVWGYRTGDGEYYGGFMILRNAGHGTYLNQAQRAWYSSLYHYFFYFDENYN